MGFWSNLFRKKPAADQYYLSVCCIIKDENPYLSEWMNHHLKVGVEHFFIYDNGSKRPVADTINELGFGDIATVNTIYGKARQVRAYGDCIKFYGQASRWIAFIDVDEFVNAKATHGNLPLFLKDYEPYGALGVNDIIFGSSRHLKRTNRPQLESFQLRAGDDFHENSHIKSIVQPRYVKSSFNAHSFTYVDGKFCVNENFDHIEGPYSDVSIQKIQLNHYYCRSFEEFEEKVKRGFGDTGKARKIELFAHHDQRANEVKDTTILELFKN